MKLTVRYNLYIAENHPSVAEENFDIDAFENFGVESKDGLTFIRALDKVLIVKTVDLIDVKLI